MSGKMHRSIIATIIQATNGSEPERIVLSGISGAMPFMT
jgi:hypothetical protein